MAEDLSPIDSEQQLVDSNEKKLILENGHQEEPDFSDPEDYEDDINDEGLN